MQGSSEPMDIDSGQESSGHGSPRSLSVELEVINSSTSKFTVGAPGYCWYCGHALGRSKVTLCRPCPQY